ncbi:MAG: metallophosphoesterase [Hyphomicrobiaceae bacterium]|nr:metallophosphoesterase [Hyphomicrobiaceae bacterium]
MKIEIPDFCLVVLAGSQAAATTAFARKHFRAEEIVALDRAQTWHRLAGERLRRRKLTVIDAPDIDTQQRSALVTLAREYHARPIAIVLDPGGQGLAEHGAETMEKDGFRTVFALPSPQVIEATAIERTRLAADQRHQQGPFDIIGDVHGCADELEQLLRQLGYGVTLTGEGEARRALTTAPGNRRAFFVGDLVDRGPRSPDVLRIVMAMVQAGHALCVPGNHDAKFVRWLSGRQVKLTHGLDRTVAQFEGECAAFKAQVKTFLQSLVSHAWLADGRLAIAHAGIKEEMMGRSSGAVREFCLYGENTGEHDEFGLPVRYHWAAEYRGSTQIVYGHTPVPQAEWLNNTLCVDTGCVFGGKLTALRWPENEIVSVPAARVYSEPIRPLGHPPVRPGTLTGAQG